jgi:hypothetical protein
MAFCVGRVALLFGDDGKGTGMYKCPETVLRLELVRNVIYLRIEVVGSEQRKLCKNKIIIQDFGQSTRSCLFWPEL